MKKNAATTTDNMLRDAVTGWETDGWLQMSDVITNKRNSAQSNNTAEATLTGLGAAVSVWPGAWENKLVCQNQLATQKQR